MAYNAAEPRGLVSGHQSSPVFTIIFKSFYYFTGTADLYEKSNIIGLQTNVYHMYTKQLLLKTKTDS